MNYKLIIKLVKFQIKAIDLNAKYIYISQVTLLTISKD